MSILDTLPAPFLDPLVFGPEPRRMTSDEAAALISAANDTRVFGCCGVRGRGVVCWRCGLPYLPYSPPRGDRTT